MNKKGLRFNEGKLRYDLIPPSVLKALAEVYTYGDAKYGESAGGCNRNWEKGLDWTSVIASAVRHIEAFRSGLDFDESGLLHIAHAMTNLSFLIEYYNTHPELDDRAKSWKGNNKKIGLDLDGVIFDFDTAYQKRFNVKMNPYWATNYMMSEHLKELEGDKEFWINLPLLNKPKCEITAYVTSRSIPVEWIMESIEKNGLPCAPVVAVPWGASKVEALKDYNITCMVDDKWENFKEINEAGIMCYLMDSQSNRYYNVGGMRIYNLDNLQ